MAHKSCLQILTGFTLLQFIVACAPGGGFHNQETSPTADRQIPIKLQFIPGDQAPVTPENLKPEPISTPKSVEQKPSPPSTQKPVDKEPPQPPAPAGLIKPTIYYFPVINEDKSSCPAKQPLLDPKGKTLTKVCASTYAACALQGACGVIQNGQLRSYNINGRHAGQNRFFEITDKDCKFGFGAENSCLDPFYTVAADLNIYDPGDVIYVPGLRGLDLPNGTKHNGYFIIRDNGRAIKGEGRFDFFSGYYSWRDDKNPFTKAGLGDTKHRLPYYKVKGATAQAVLEHRQFPGLPEQSIDSQP